MRHLIYLVSLLYLLVTTVNGLFFYVPKEGHKCFYIDIPAQTEFRAEYESPDTTDTLKTIIRVFEPNTENRNADTIIKKQTTEKKGFITLKTMVQGEHWICISINSIDYDVPDTIRMRFKLKLQMGIHSEEYEDLAKKMDMDDLQLTLLKLKDRVQEIQRAQDYAKEKNIISAKVIEKSHHKSTIIAVIQIGMLLITAFYQTKHLRNYFHKKKLV